jgi:hypothetical protein
MIIDHFQEMAFFKLIEGTGYEGMPEQALWRKDNEW